MLYAFTSKNYIGLSATGDGISKVSAALVTVNMRSVGSAVSSDSSWSAGEKSVNDLALALEDCQALEAASLRPHDKFSATSVIASLRYLQHLSSELGKPIEEVTRDEIITAFKAEQARNPEPAA